MRLITKPPARGAIVRVRFRQYLVEDVVLPPAPGDATLVRMACLDDDAQGEPLEVLWEKEVDPEILDGESWQDLATKGFDPPKLFSAYLHTLRWNCVTATDPDLFQSPLRAGIKLWTYQLEPLRKALQLPRVNLFIADDVGIGKTIEAGLIARELLLRRKVKDIIVVCPPSVVTQWKEELENRFGLTFEILDREYIARMRQEHGYAVNPWETHRRFIISQRRLIDEDYQGPLRDKLGELRPGSLLILDEAHNAAPATGLKYAVDSKITRAIRDLAPRFEHRLFLSATPHNGHSNSFSALLELLDGQRFCRGVPVTDRKLLDAVMVRRLKDDIRMIEGGFPERKVIQIDIDGLPDDAPELELSCLLDGYRKLREERLKGETLPKKAAAALVNTGLQQRLLSSVEAFARTLKGHRKKILEQWQETSATQPAEGSDLQSLGEQRAPGASPAGLLGGRRLDLLGAGVDSDDDRAILDDAELRADENLQFETATLATCTQSDSQDNRALFAEEKRLLDEMSEIAETSRALPDERVRRLIAWIRENMCPDLPEVDSATSSHHDQPPARWNSKRLLIFTEYTATKTYLEQQLKAAITGTDQANRRIATFTGPTSHQRREEIKRAFNGDPDVYPLRILIANDAAREGINLQTRCADLFHFDVPWNPSRMEQRNGRIDRKLQPASTVRCHYFVYKQRPEDRILAVLVKKTETIKKELGSLSQVLEGRLAEKLAENGIRHDDVARLEDDINKEDLDITLKQTVAEEFDEALADEGSGDDRQRRSALIEQLDTLRLHLDKAKQWIGFEEGHFRAAISCSLELMGADPLSSADSPATAGAQGARQSKDNQRRYSFPPLDQRAGADPTWADTMDTLRAPRRKDQSPWEWRRDAPIRPVVFEDPGTLDEDVVHLHLEQRVVQRLLGRFRAQGFVHHDLARACLAHTEDAQVHIVLLGRICLYGPHAARLHEELISVSALWKDPSLRKSVLTPDERSTEQQTRRVLEQALLPHRGRPRIAKEIYQRFQAAGPRDVTELLPHLEMRGRERIAAVARLLTERGAAEAKAMRQIITEQKRRIARATRKADKAFAGTTDLLSFAKEERRQMEADRRHWNKRLAAIDDELAAEPKRIEGFYKVKAERLEPVGLVYLWPVTG